jgi:beta-lactamase class A
MKINTRDAERSGRRNFLKAIVGTAAMAPLGMMAEMGAESTANVQTILSLFEKLSGDKAVKIFAPAAKGKPAFTVEMNAAKQLFVGSAVKTFILAEALRQADTPNVVQTLTAKQLTLDASVWNLDSATFNPPNLIGAVSERTALEAMIQHSDNTATDMSLKLVGPDNVRRFIASAQLGNTEIPDSTRSLFGYLLGAKDYKTFSWNELMAAANSPMVNSPMNKAQTMASSAADFVSYYSRALQGEFFQNKETLNEYRRILSLGDAIWLLPLPLGGSAFCKGGSIDVPGFHALCAPGGMLLEDRWVYFSFIYNWYAPAETDPKTVAEFLKSASQAMVMVKDVLAA